MRWDDRNRDWLRTRGLGTDAIALYNFLRHSAAHPSGIIDCSAETMGFRCEFTRSSRTKAALAILTKQDADKRLGDRDPLFIYDEYLPAGYLVGWPEMFPPSSFDETFSRVKFLSKLVDCPAKTAALDELTPYIKRWPNPRLRESPMTADDGAPEPLHPEEIPADAVPAPKPRPAPRAPSRPAPAEVEAVTVDHLAALFAHYLPMRPQPVPYELKPNAEFGGRLAKLIVEQPRDKSWRAFFAAAARLVDAKGVIVVEGERVSVQGMRTLFDKRVAEHIKAEAGMKPKEGAE